jgi:hypothetical protein
MYPFYVVINLKNLYQLFSFDCKSLEILLEFINFYYYKNMSTNYNSKYRGQLK